MLWCWPAVVLCSSSECRVALLFDFIVSRSRILCHSASNQGTRLKINEWILLVSLFVAAIRPFREFAERLLIFGSMHLADFGLEVFFSLLHLPQKTLFFLFFRLQPESSSPGEALRNSSADEFVWCRVCCPSAVAQQSGREGPVCGERFRPWVYPAQHWSFVVFTYTYEDLNFTSCRSSEGQTDLWPGCPRPEEGQRFTCTSQGYIWYWTCLYCLTAAVFS